MQDDATCRVNTILTQARLFQSHTGRASIDTAAAAALISLTALPVCFHFESFPLYLTGQTVVKIVNVYSAVTLQLREAFHESEHDTQPARTLTDGTTRGASSSLAWFGDETESCAIVLTMIETIAFTCKLLLAHTDLDLASVPLDSSELVIWSFEAQRVIVEKLGNMLGVRNTIKQCFDRLPQQGERPANVLGILEELQGRLEKLGVRADAWLTLENAFALDMAGPEAEEEEVIKEAVLKVMPKLELPPHCLPINESSTSTFEGVGQWQTQPYTMDAVPDQTYLTAAFPSQPSIHTNLAPPPPETPLGSGPGPLPTSWNDQPEAAGRSSHSNWCAGNLQLAWPGWTHADFTMLALAADGFEGASMDADGGGFNPAVPRIMPGEGMDGSAQQGAGDVGSLDTPQGRSQGPTGMVQPGSQLAYHAHNFESSLGLSTMQKDQLGAFLEPMYLQPATARHDMKPSTDPQDLKTARIDVQTRPCQSDPWKEARTSAQAVMGEGPSSHAGQIFGQDVWAEKPIGSRQLSDIDRRVQETLALSRAVRPLIDDGHDERSAKRKGKGKGRESPQLSANEMSLAQALVMLRAIPRLVDDDTCRSGGKGE